VYIGIRKLYTEDLARNKNLFAHKDHLMILNTYLTSKNLISEINLCVTSYIVHPINCISTMIKAQCIWIIWLRIFFIKDARNFFSCLTILGEFLQQKCLYVLRIELSPTLYRSRNHKLQRGYKTTIIFTVTSELEPLEL